jgi:hypothetical protein
MSTERREPGEDELLPTPAEPLDEDWRPTPPPGWGNQGGVPDTGPYQPMRELDSEDGPPPRRGGPTG